MGERFTFGRFRLDAGRQTLLEDGVPVAIGSRALLLLRALVEARGEVVTKAELMEAAWPGAVVEESNLTVQIAWLRKRLGCSSEGQAWIATFPRVGYRFAGPLGVVQQDDRPADLARSPMQLDPVGRDRIDGEAFELFVRGRALCMQSPHGNKLARRYLSKAIGLEPRFAAAHACLGHTYLGAALNYGEAPDENRVLARALVLTALALDPNDPVARAALGYIRLYEGKLEEAQAAWEAALRIDPANTDALANMADMKVHAGRPDEALALVEKALRLHPYPPGWYYWNAGFAYYAAGRYAEAADALRNEEAGRLPSTRILAASLAQLGLLDEARAEARGFIGMNPGFQATRWGATQPFKHDADRQHFIDGYIRAGLPR
jgi:DNA-binding winged helix-turn-helix (wHTH) protein/Tfp pilus assembly protein PilF